MLPSLIIDVCCQTHKGIIQLAWDFAELVIMCSLTFAPCRHLCWPDLCAHPTFVPSDICAQRHLCLPTFVPIDTCAHPTLCAHRHLCPPCPPTLVPTDTCAHRHLCPPPFVPTAICAHRHLCPPTDTCSQRHLCPLHYFLLRSDNTTVCLPFVCCVCCLQEGSFHFIFKNCSI